MSLMEPDGGLATELTSPAFHNRNKRWHCRSERSKCARPTKKGESRKAPARSGAQPAVGDRVGAYSRLPNADGQSVCPG